MIKLAGGAAEAEHLMRLERGAGWHGTYALTVAHMVTDLLSDGEPVEDVLVETDDGEQHEGTLSAFDAQEQTITVNGVPINVDDITRVTVGC
jgi:small nuclear ribonucleoprotein (snRNP)-like protein